MKNQTKKTTFFLYIKKPLNAACYDRCRLICLILTFFVFCCGEVQGWGWRVWGPTSPWARPFNSHYSGSPTWVPARGPQAQPDLFPVWPGRQGHGCNDFASGLLAWEWVSQHCQAQRPGRGGGLGQEAPGRDPKDGVGEGTGGQGEPTGWAPWSPPTPGFLEAVGGVALAREPQVFQQPPKWSPLT